MHEINFAIHIRLHFNALNTVYHLIRRNRTKPTWFSQSEALLFYTKQCVSVVRTRDFSPRDTYTRVPIYYTLVIFNQITSVADMHYGRGVTTGEVTTPRGLTLPIDLK